MGYQGSDSSEGSEVKEGDKSKDGKEGGKDVETAALNHSGVCWLDVAQSDCLNPYEKQNKAIFTF